MKEEGKRRPICSWVPKGKAALMFTWRCFIKKGGKEGREKKNGGRGGGRGDGFLHPFDEKRRGEIQRHRKGEEEKATSQLSLASVRFKRRKGTPGGTVFREEKSDERSPTLFPFQKKEKKKR